MLAMLAYASAVIHGTWTLSAEVVRTAADYLQHFYSHFTSFDLQFLYLTELNLVFFFILDEVLIRNELRSRIFVIKVVDCKGDK